MTKRVISMKKVRRGGLAFAAPFESGEFWQAVMVAGEGNSYTGVLARREDGKRWGEIVARWDGKETRIGTFERVKVWGQKPVWIGRLELTGEWSRLPLETRRGTAGIEDSSEDYVRDALVDAAVDYFTRYGKPRAIFTTTGRVRWDDAIEVVPVRGGGSGSGIPRYISNLDHIDAFNSRGKEQPVFGANSELLHSAVGDRVIIDDGAVVKRSYISNQAFVGGEVIDSYVGDRVLLSDGSRLCQAHINQGVHVGRGAELIGGNYLNIDIRNPEARVPSGVCVHGRAAEGRRDLRYLVLGPIGYASLTAIEDEGNPCAIWFSGEEFFLDELIKALYLGYEDECSRLDELLNIHGEQVRDQLRALLPLLVTMFPEELTPEDIELAKTGKREAGDSE